MFYLAVETEVEVCFHRGDGYHAVPVVAAPTDRALQEQLMLRLEAVANSLGARSGQPTSIVCVWEDLPALREVFDLPVVWHIGEEGEMEDLPPHLEVRSDDTVVRGKEDMAKFVASLLASYR